MHRFYSGDTKDRSGQLELTHEMWINDIALANQILRVLRMRVGDEFVLFDGQSKEVLYEITDVEPRALRVQKVTDLVPKYPPRKVTLAWSMLKKDKNEWVLQKCTELGVTHFVPLLTERTEKTSFDESRAQKIIIEASEQCGRHDIPTIQEPIDIRIFIGQHDETSVVYVADMDGEEPEKTELDHVIVLVGPEGGWSEPEREFFKERQLLLIGLGHFTQRAETACISAVQKLV